MAAIGDGWATDAWVEAGWDGEAWSEGAAPPSAGVINNPWIWKLYKVGVCACLFFPFPT